MQPTIHDKPSSTLSKEKRDWLSLINESVHTSDDVDIGEIYTVSRNFIVVKRGFVNIHYYYIPVIRVEGWDGDVLWLKVTEKEVREKYERNTSPDPKQYYVNEFPYYTAAYYYPLPLIPRRRLALGNIPKMKDLFLQKKFHGYLLVIFAINHLNQKMSLISIWKLQDIKSFFIIEI